MHHYAHAFFNQVAQSAACNQFHSLRQRCCRWLLMTHDRMQADEFLLTQEFLAMMLGVQRTGVSAAAGALQRAGLIRYSRGHVTILDRAGLEKQSCECYGVAKLEFDRLLGDLTAGAVVGRAPARQNLLPFPSPAPPNLSQADPRGIPADVRTITMNRARQSPAREKPRACVQIAAAMAPW